MAAVREKGYSLIEVLAALFIAAVLVTAAGSSFAGWGPKYRLHRAAWEITSKMHSLRFRAVFEGAAYRMNFNGAGFTVSHRKSQDDDWIDAETCFLEGVAVCATSSPGFFPSGAVSPLASVYVSAAGRTIRITVAISGRIKAVEI